MQIQKLFDRWQKEPSILENIQNWKVEAERKASFCPLPVDLHPELVNALHRQSITSLYSHQIESWRNTRQHLHQVISTGTASGKTLCYNLAVLDTLVKDPDARALYIFPTKALAYDQKENLDDWNRILSSQFRVPVDTYDGDTPTNRRPGVRINTRLVITNPDMLHLAILPYHTRWSVFFTNVRFVIIDEIHIYRGVFGSHFTNVIRRLKRITQFYGSNPEFILTSATIDNPKEHAEKLIEDSVEVVDKDGASHGEKHFLFYNPPIMNHHLGIRRNALQEAVRIIDDLITYKQQTIVFAKTRRAVELLLNYLRQNSTIPSEQIRGYRSGYLPADRRSIEEGLREGQIRVVVATTALELGIDIGKISAAILIGYPGTIAGTLQQAGRAGRGVEASLAVLVTSANPLDQFLARHPDYFFEHAPEQALVDPDNLLILLEHFRCAAAELPFCNGDSFGSVGSSTVQQYLEYLTQSGEIYASQGKYFWISENLPASDISLRSTSAKTVDLVCEQDSKEMSIGKVDLDSAYWMVHPGAIYLHEGQSYLVDDLDLRHYSAKLSHVLTDYFTQAITHKTITILNTSESSDIGNRVIGHGEIKVTTQVTGYKKIRWFTNEVIGRHDIDSPETSLETTGYWIVLAEEMIRTLREKGLWLSDPIDYGPGWQSIRKNVRKRDRYLCQNCGAGEGEQQHHVHHKIPFRTFESVEEANQLSNLTTLCQQCHRSAEFNVIIRSGLAGLAYSLGNIAPLFLMCDAHDIGIHSDPVSTPFEGRPAVIIFEQIAAGIGYSRHLYKLHNELLKNALSLISECSCETGCPSCVGPSGENGQGGRHETLALLEELIKPA